MIVLKSNQQLKEVNIQLLVIHRLKIVHLVQQKKNTRLL